MTSVSITCGILLILIGAIGYVYGMSAGNASLTALIPAAFGALILVLSAIAAANEGLRKHLMHGVMLVALIGFILTAGRVLMKISSIEMSPAVISQLSMAAVCLILMILGGRSFANARRAG
jgi:hypothetical protein